MKVAYFVSRFPKITETFVLYEALALLKLGVDVEIFPLVEHREDAAHPEAEEMESRVTRVSVGVRECWLVARTALFVSPIKFLRALRSLFRCSGGSPAHIIRALALLVKIVAISDEIKRRGFDHVHAHFATHPALAACMARDLTGIPYTFTAHGSDLHRDPRGLRAKILGSAFAVTISDYNRAFMLEHAGQELADRIRVFRCGADLSKFQGGVHGKDGPFRIACVAALREVKGHRFLLDGLGVLREANIPFECCLAGDGPLRRQLEEDVQARGLGAHVRFLGSQSRDEVAALLAQSNVIALTSIQDRAGRREGIPVSLMEGMAAGLPAVASRISGIPELVEDGVSGWLTPPGDGGAIGEALLRLARDPGCARQMGDEGRRRVIASYDLTVNAATFAAALKESVGA